MLNASQTERTRKYIIGGLNIRDDLLQFSSKTSPAIVIIK